MCKEERKRSSGVEQKNLIYVIMIRCVGGKLRHLKEAQKASRNKVKWKRCGDDDYQGQWCLSGGSCMDVFDRFI